MEISTEKSKIMAFCRKDPVQSKICVDNKIFERVNQFSYLDYKLSFMEELNISDKIIKFNTPVGIINNIMKPNLVEHTCTFTYVSKTCPLLWYKHTNMEGGQSGTYLRLMRASSGLRVSIAKTYRDEKKRK